MIIASRLNSIGSAGTNISLVFELVTTTGLQSSGEAVIDPTWTEPEIEAAWAEAARQALRVDGHTVVEGESVILFGAISKV